MFYDDKYTLRRNISYKDYVIENKEYKLSLGDYTFPIKIKISTFYETKDVKVSKDKDELKKDLSNKVLKELDYIIPASAKLLDVKHNYNVKNNMLEYTITVTTSENIAQIDMLTKSQAQQIIKEQNVHFILLLFQLIMLLLMQMEVLLRQLQNL